MLSRKERKALATLEKQNVKRLEEEVRKQKQVAMRHGMSIKLLESFENDHRLKLPTGFPVAVRVNVPVWDCQALLEDAKLLMTKFPSAVQYGGLHDGMWSTLCLRSMDGSTNNDCASNQYYETSAWSESLYIVPHLLSLLSAGVADNETFSLFQRIRLSIIPPNCNVAWHVDYENTQRDGPIRMHIPIQCSDQFVLCIGGQNVVMNEGETWLGQFELPHRLCNQNAGMTRIHLVVDMFPQRKVAACTTPKSASSGSLESASSVGQDNNTETSEAPAVYVAPTAASADFDQLQSAEEAPLVVVDIVKVIPTAAIGCLVEVPAVLVSPITTVPMAPAVPVLPVVSVVPIIDVFKVVTDLFVAVERVAEGALVPVLEAVLPLPTVVDSLTPMEPLLMEDTLEVVVVKEEREVVMEVPIDIKRVEEVLGELDWEPLRRSEFGRAVEQAFHRLYSYPYQPPTGSTKPLSNRVVSNEGEICNRGRDEASVCGEEAGLGEEETNGAREEKQNDDAIVGDAYGWTGERGVADTIAQCVAAFSDYRWGGPFASTTEARAAVEASYYLKD